MLSVKRRECGGPWLANVVVLWVGLGLQRVLKTTFERSLSRLGLGGRVFKTAQDFGQQCEAKNRK